MFKSQFVKGLAVALVMLALPIGWAVAGNAEKSKAEKPGQGPDGKIPIFALAQKAGLTTLAAAVEAAGLQKTLTVDGPFTVFAPTNEAFAALPQGTLESLLKDPEALKNILLYHVVSGEVKAEDVVQLTSANTAQGQAVSVMVSEGGVMINDANVIQTDIMAKNGVVHLIDKVLLPN